GARDARLRDAVQRTLQSRSKVVIPAFSVGRTQEIVYALNEMIERHELPDFSAFVDSPLAISATKIYQKHPECFHKDLVEDIMSGDDPFDFPKLRFTRSVEDSKDINRVRGACVIISAAGMCTAGRIRHHLRNHIGNENNLILFVGYQAQNTLGRRIRDGFSPVRIFGEQTEVMAQVEAIDGFSAHADRGQLLTWFGGIPEPPAYTIVTHGETEASFSFRDALDKQMSARAIVPELGEVIDLIPENRAIEDLMEEQRLRPLEEPAEEDPKRVDQPDPD
ncbi:MAG TPA: MBL fold metallo-hydrolase RNA specificity domain-containing protein, partial [Armatimonadota bacterium]|nr:MBL fold metallo-hydrolase RNA specificity domain-containing protein [Armatimonadota bacterium]